MRLPAEQSSDGRPAHSRTPSGDPADVEVPDRILPDDVRTHPLSLLDPNGRLFWWRGGLYRGIPYERVSLCKGLFASGLMDRLIADGLFIETDLTSHVASGYGVVLRHRKLPFVSYAYEWCAPMLRDAGLVTLRLELELMRHGFSLQDAHPWNVLFDGSRPVFVDFGSIVPLDSAGTWGASDPFLRYFMYPLRLMASGHSTIARSLLRNWRTGVSAADFMTLTGERIGGGAGSKWRRRARNGLRALLGSHGTRTAEGVKPSTSRARQALIEELLEAIEAIEVRVDRSGWSDYYGCFPAFVPGHDWHQKQHAVHRVLSELRPRSLIDVGSNRGWYAQLAAAIGAEVVAFDRDECCVAALYEEAKKAHAALLPLVMAFDDPSPGYGIANRTFPPATERLRCEMAMALGLVHHLAFETRLSFDQISQGLAEFSERWLLVEFIPSDDKFFRAGWPRDCAWYTLDGFTAALRKHYRSIEVLPSCPSPRALLLCAK